MNWRWLSAAFIDPRYELTAKQRHELWSRVIQLPGVKRTVFLFFAPVIAVPAVLLVGLHLLMTAPGLRHIVWFVGFMGVTIVLPTAALVMQIRALKAWRRFQEHALLGMERGACAACGHAFTADESDLARCPACGTDREGVLCPKCGYSLRGLLGRSGRCPECGGSIAPAACRICGYSFRGLGDDVQICPECGALRGLQPPLDMIQKTHAGGLLRELAWPSFISRRFELDHEDRRSLLREARRSFQEDRSARRWYLAGLVTPGALFFVVAMSYLQRIGPSIVVFISATVISAAGLALVLLLSHRFAARRTYAPHLWRIMRLRGLDVCLHCGRWLEGRREASDRCPSCGEAIGEDRT